MPEHHGRFDEFFVWSGHNIQICMISLTIFSLIMQRGPSISSCGLPIKVVYRKVASSNTSRLEAHAGFFRLLMKGIFDPYVL